MKDQDDKATTLLKENNLKITSTRLELLTHLMSQKSAVTQSWIQDKMTSTDRITLYRTLSTFLEKNILHIVSTSSAKNHFALRSEDYHSQKKTHIHFSCRKCEKITCQNLEDVPTLSLPEFQIENIDINVSGLCPTCV